MLEKRKASLSFCVNKKIVYQALFACGCVSMWVNLCLRERMGEGLLQNK